MFSQKRLLSVFLAVVLLAGLAVPVRVSAYGTSVLSCVISSENTKQVSVQLQAASGIASDDNTLYLFALPTYAGSLSGQTPVASIPYTGGGVYSFTTDLNANTSSSLLYSKFYVGVRSQGKYKSITDGNYITNPERIASSRLPRTQTASKKGIHISHAILTDVEELNIKQAFFNISLSDFISNSPTELSYTYNGKTYYYTDVVKDYDHQIGNLSKAGMAVTITLLNKYKSGYEYLLHPGAAYREGTASYAVNTSTQQGLEVVSAATHFLAERYNGTNADLGKVDNWIVGNEVNDNLQYYYMGQQDVNTFVREYLQTFRVMYTAVKSAYANANVYICLQHRWNTEDSATDYGGKRFLDIFSACAKAQGDIDWGLSYHPYSFPMNDPDILNDGEPSKNSDGSSTFGGEVTNAPTTPVITMKNLNVLVDYFHSAALLNPAGQVRSIILGEQGYTSYSNITGRNEAKQAANIALAYYMAEMNPDIDAFLLRCHCDEEEGSAYYRFGLREMTANGDPADAKYAYEIYKYIDTPSSLQYTEFAKDTLGIRDWSDVVPGWNAGKFSTMGTVTEAPLYTVSGSSGTILVDGMLNQWRPGYNVFAIGQFDYEPIKYDDGVAVANSFAYYMDYQTIEKRFASPVSIGSYLTLNAHFKPKDGSGAADKLEVKIRLRSGDDVFTAAGIVDVNRNYTLSLDLGQWAGRNSVDTLEVLIREYGQQKSFDGTFTIYDVTSAASVTGAAVLPGTTAVFTDLSGATLTYQKQFDYTGKAIEPEVTVTLKGQTLTRNKDYALIYNNNIGPGSGKITVVGIGAYSGYTTVTFHILGGSPTVYNGVDYAPVYAYGYYKENNPNVVAEVGDDPMALLEHFVTKGMRYALQGTGSFNVLAYAKINDDLQKEFGSDWPAYYRHYLTVGIAEGRSISGVKPEDMEAPAYPGTACHVAAEIPAVTPTCLTAGSTAGSKCSICGTILTAPKVLAPLGHSYTDETDDTCNTCGIVRDLENPTTPMYRLYNTNSGEHFYTGSLEELGILINAAWQYEGIAWNAPTSFGDPVYRLYNPNSSDHHYTMSADERDMLVSLGWRYEGVAWNSVPANSENSMVLYRLYNPNADCGSHHYTGSAEERETLVAAGWIYEGTGWFGLVK